MCAAPRERAVYAANVLFALWSPSPARSPAMEISSSKASQCRPRPLILTCFRCLAVPRSKRGNHASGTPMVRPSLNSTHMQSGSNLTRFALTEELIPHPLDQIPICLDDLQQLTENSGVVAIISRLLEPPVPARTSLPCRLSQREYGPAHEASLHSNKRRI